MHAKRTRDRKRVFMENMEDIISTLQHENEVLRNHLFRIGGSIVEYETDSNRSQTPPLISPALKPSSISSEDSIVIDSSKINVGQRYQPLESDYSYQTEEESLVKSGAFLYDLVAMTQGNMHGRFTDSGAASPVCTSSGSSCCHETH